MTDYVLWDIDGVLNPHLAWNLDEDAGWVPLQTSWVTWMVNPELHGPIFEEYDDAGVVQVWASTWAADSNVLAEAFDSPPLGHVPLDLPSDQPSWKIPSIQKWLDANTSSEDRIVWVDDQLEDDAYEWAAKDSRILLVKTDPAVGFGESDHQEVKKFLGIL